jgi:hypothetical protein
MTEEQQKRLVPQICASFVKEKVDDSIQRRVPVGIRV